MAGKKEKKAKKQKKAPGTDHEKQVPNEQVQDERSFQFGGLPERDLKKGLGCGG